MPTFAVNLKKKSASTVKANLLETGVGPTTVTYSSSGVYQAMADIQNNIGVMNQLLSPTFRESIFA
jgi:hypothetical protein